MARAQMSHANSTGSLGDGLRNGVLGMTGCSSWEAKLDQRSQVEKIPRVITQLTDHPIQTMAA